MSVYMIFNFNVTDPEGFAPYGKAVRPILARHRAEVLAVDFDAETIEGEGFEANVILRFVSKENAMAFYNDPEYLPLRNLRSATTSDGTAALLKEFVRPA